MLNLPIAMFNHLLISLVFFLAQTANISIASPQPGDILRGQVEIVGNMDVPNFASAELAFSYASNPADSWFTIQTFSQPVSRSHARRLGHDHAHRWRLHSALARLSSGWLLSGCGCFRFENPQRRASSRLDTPTATESAAHS